MDADASRVTHIYKILPEMDSLDADATRVTLVYTIQIHPEIDTSQL